MQAPTSSGLNSCLDGSIYLGREKEPLVGVFGDDPRASATVELGRRACALIVEGMVRKAQELIERVEKGA